MPTRRAPAVKTGGKNPWLGCCAVALLAIALYAPSLAFDFTYDDPIIVAQNPAVQKWGEWKRIFLSDYWPGLSSALYRPVTILSFAIERPIHGGLPAGFHATNILLHAAVCVLVFLVSRRILGPGWKAAAVGVFFAAHPIHSEAVCGVVGRAELLSSLFALAALWIWMRRRAGGDGAGAMWPAYSLFLLALGSKENAIILPLWMLLWEVAQDRSGPPARQLLRKAFSPPYLAFLAPALLFLALRAGVLGGFAASMNPDPPFVENPLGAMPLSERAIQATANQLRGLLLHFVPYPLVADYSYNTLPARQSILPAASMLALAGAVAFLWLIPYARGRVTILGAAWYLAGILPTSNILFPVGTVFAERLYYLPSFGLILGVVAAADWAWSGRASQAAAGAFPAARLGPACVLVVTGMFSLLTWSRIPVWKSDLALFTDTVSRAPENAKARLRFGDALVRSGSPREGLEQYERALEIYPRYAAPAMNMVAALNAIGRHTEAIAAGERARGLLKEENPALLYNMGLAYMSQGDTVRFLEFMNRALQLDPGNRQAHLQLGRYYLRQPWEQDAARRHFEKALELAPDAPDASVVRNLLRRLEANR